MPLPAALGPAAAVGAKHAVLRAAPYAASFSSATLAAVLARLAWQRLPDWIKEDVSFQKLEGDKGEMDRLSSVVEKLQALADTGSAKLASPVPHLHAAILAYMQLSAQLKLVAPEARDYLFESCGRPCSTKDLEGLKEALDYATWAYYVDDKDRLRGYLEDVDLFLLNNTMPTRPGYVGHYAAVSPEKKILLIGVKGTSSLEDLLTDCCGRAVPYDSGAGDDASRVEVRGVIPEQISAFEETVEVASGHEIIWVEEGDQDHHIRCHEGILVATKRLADQVQSKVEDLVVGCGYKLVLAGHSLGGSAASLLAFLMRSRIPELTDESIQVYAFAPPPVVDHDASVAAAPFITSVVNNSDIIPRSSLANLAVFLEFLRSVSQRLVEEGLNPTGLSSTAAFLGKLAQGTGGDMLMTLEEVDNALTAAHDKVELRDPDHLYIPGRAIIMYERWEKEVEELKEGGDFVVLQSSDTDNVACVISDGTAAALRTFEVDGYRMLSDHITASYYSRIEALTFPEDAEDMLELANPELTPEPSKLLCSCFQ